VSLRLVVDHPTFGESCRVQTQSTEESGMVDGDAVWTNRPLAASLSFI
jgi:hypothetical protein